MSLFIRSCSILRSIYIFFAVLVTVLDHGRALVTANVFLACAFFFVLCFLFLHGRSVLSTIPLDTPLFILIYFAVLSGKVVDRHPGRIYILFLLSSTVMMLVNGRMYEIPPERPFYSY